MKYELSPSNATDHAWLDRLRRDVYRELFDATWGGWDEARHQRHFAESLAQGNISIIEVDSRRIGMLQLIQHDDAIEVGEIQILTADQNAGVGTAVLRDVIEQATRQGQRVRLSTGLKNERALRLYLRLGFREVARSDTHYRLEF